MRMQWIVAALVLAGVAAAQDPGPGRGRGRGPFGPGANPGFPGARFLGAEAGMPGRVVKNAPYTADLITESTQALPDGNHIHQNITVHVSRDSEGRTRREQPLNSLNIAPNSNLPPVVFINDPVAGVNYALNAKDHTATRSAWNHPGRSNQSKAAGPPPGGRNHFGNNPNVKTELLGKQTIEGVVAEGTRTTMTIPAGQIGNDQPIQIVTESWYSPDLQAVVLHKHTDPRSGETVSRIANLSRSEPSAALFQIPADYKVTESSRPPRTTPPSGR